MKNFGNRFAEIVGTILGWCYLYLIINPILYTHAILLGIKCRIQLHRLVDDGFEVSENERYKYAKKCAEDLLDRYSKIFKVKLR